MKSNEKSSNTRAMGYFALNTGYQVGVLWFAMSTYAIFFLSPKEWRYLTFVIQIKIHNNNQESGSKFDFLVKIIKKSQFLSKKSKKYNFHKWPL